MPRGTNSSEGAGAGAGASADAEADTDADAGAGDSIGHAGEARRTCASNVVGSENEGCTMVANAAADTDADAVADADATTAAALPASPPAAAAAAVAVGVASDDDIVEEAAKEDERMAQRRKAEAEAEEAVVDANGRAGVVANGGSVPPAAPAAAASLAPFLRRLDSDPEMSSGDAVATGLPGVEVVRHVAQLSRMYDSYAQLAPTPAAAATLAASRAVPPTYQSSSSSLLLPPPTFPTTFPQSPAAPRFTFSSAALAAALRTQAAIATADAAPTPDATVSIRPPHVLVDASAGALAADADSSSTPLPPRDTATVLHETFMRACRRFAKGFSVGFASKAFFGAVTVLLKSAGSWSKLLRVLRTSGAHLLFGTPLQYGLCLGTLVALFETMLRFRFQLPGRRGIVVGAATAAATASPDAVAKDVPVTPRRSTWRSSASTRSIVLAALAGSLSYAFLPEHDRVSIALFLAVRALEVLGAEFVRHVDSDSADATTSAAAAAAAALALAASPAAAAPPQPAFALVRAARHVLRHTELLVFCAASSELFWAGLYHPHTLEPSYLAFLTYHCAKTPAQLSYFALTHGSCLSAQHPPYPVAWDAIQRARMGAPVVATAAAALPLLSPHSIANMCHVLHPGESCTRATLAFLQQALVRAVPVYVPVYMIPLLAFKLRALARSPLRVLTTTASSIARSSVFFATYATVGWTIMCVLRGVHASNGTRYHTLIAGAVSALSVLIEKKQRRVELCLYVVSHALRSAYLVGLQRRAVPRIPHGVFLVYASSLFVLLWAFLRSSPSLRSSYSSLLSFVFSLRATST